MRLANFKIRSRLGYGFGLVVIMSALIGFVALRNFDILWSSTESLYKHPLVVSKAVRDIRTNIMAIHRSMKDVATAENNIQIHQAVLKVDKYEIEVYELFEIIHECFLGDMSDVEEALVTFQNWKPIREMVVKYWHDGEFEKAISHTKGRSADHVTIMNAKIQIMVDYANQKSDDLYADAYQTKLNTIKTMAILILFTFSIGIVIAVIITRSITKPLSIMSKVSKAQQKGDYSARNRITTKDETGYLAQSIDRLAASIQIQLEIKEGVANITNMMIEAKDVSAFRKNLLNILVSLTDSNVGAFYTLNKDKKQFEPSASMGFEKNRLKAFDARELEGEFGNTLKSREIFRVMDIPKDTIFQFKTISETALPWDMVTIPIINQEKITALISLAKVQNYTDQAMELLEQTLSAINTAYSNLMAEELTHQYAKVLESSEARVRLLLDSTAEAIYGLDLNGNCTFINSACLSILRYKDELELLGKNMHDLIHHSFSDGTPYDMKECRIDQALRKGEGTHVDDEVFWCKDGSSFPAEYWSLPIKYGKSIIGSVVTFLDITERKQADEEIRKSRKYTQSILDNSHDIIFTVRSDGTFHYLNKSLKPILGYKEEELSGKPFIEYVVENERKGVIKSWVERALGGSPGTYETKIIKADGEIADVFYSFSFLKEYDEVLVVLKDISEQKRAEKLLKNVHDELESKVKIRTQELMVLHREKDSFISRASHDLRTPNAAILGFSELLIQGKWGNLNKEQLERVQKIENHAQRLNRIISDLLSISRIEAGVIGIAKDDVNISNEIKNVIAEMAVTIKNNSQSIEFVDTTSPIEVIGDRNSIHQILTNLIDNSIKYNDERGKINITVDRSGSHCNVHVKDTGIGLSKEDQMHVFDEFYRVTRLGEVQSKGTGLGLAIVKRLVTQMGGNVWVKSEGPGKGSTFSFSISISQK